MSNKIFFTWNNKTLRGFLIGLALVLSLTSCNPSIAEVEDAQLQLHEGAGLAATEARYALPLAREGELRALTKNGDGTLDYRIARKTAIIEFETGYRASLDWPKGVRLSRRPVVVYNADSKPEIYEFFVLQEGRPIGTVSAYAHTTYPEIIRNVLPWVRDYKVYTTKYAGYKQVADYYPLSVYVGVVSKSGGEVNNVIDPATGKREEPPRVPKPATEPKEIRDAKAVAKIYWEIVLENADEILKMTDEQLYAKLETKWNIVSATVYAKKFEGFKSPSTYAPARTRWSGWCVPSALAELVWVWGDGKYKDVTLPDVSSSTFNFTGNNKWYQRYKSGNTGYYSFWYDIEVRKDAKGNEKPKRDNGSEPLVNLDAIKFLSKKIDNGLYYDIINAYGVGSNWDGGMYNDKGAEAVKKVTNSSITYVKLHHNVDTIYNHIASYKAPVLDSIISSGKGKNKSYHARLLVGANYRNMYVVVAGVIIPAAAIIGLKLPLYSFLVWDNGHDTKPHGYVPYWESSFAVSRVTDTVGFIY